MEADNTTDACSAINEGMPHCSIAEAMKLVTHPFDSANGN
jgi:hypothetical protein